MVKRQAAAAKSDEPKKKKGKSSKRGRKPTRKKSGSETKHEKVVEAEVNGQDQKPKTEPEDFKVLPITSELEPLKVCDFSDKDILDIEAPTFSTLPKIGCEALLGLSWNIKAEMIGGKVSCPMIHCCELCNKPILIYGRMIPCKHVFCMTCAVKDRKNCQHCRADVERIDNVRLGSIFMCTEGGRRYGKDGCRRTYMSPRDLQAHIMHRHTANANRPKLKVGMVAGTPQQNSAASTPGLTPQNHKAPLSIDVHLAQHNQHPHHPLHNAHALHQRSSLSPRPNNMMPHAGNRRLLSPAGGGIPHHHNIPIQRHPSLQQQHHLLQQHHHHHLLSSGSALSKGVRPPRISPGLNLPPPTRTPSADGTPAYSPMPSPSMPSSSSSLIRPPLGSPASMVRSGASNLINVPVYDATGAKQFPPIHRSPMQPHMNIAMAAASNFYATTAPPPFLPSVTPKVEPAAASSPYPQLNLNVPPPNFPLRQTWTQPTATRPEHSSFFSS